MDHTLDNGARASLFGSCANRVVPLGWHALHVLDLAHLLVSQEWTASQVGVAFFARHAAFAHCLQAGLVERINVDRALARCVIALRVGELCAHVLSKRHNKIWRAIARIFRRGLLIRARLVSIVENMARVTNCVPSAVSPGRIADISDVKIVFCLAVVRTAEAAQAVELILVCINSECGRRVHVRNGNAANRETDLHFAWIFIFEDSDAVRQHPGSAVGDSERISFGVCRYLAVVRYHHLDAVQVNGNCRQAHRCVVAVAMAMPDLNFKLLE